MSDFKTESIAYLLTEILAAAAGGSRGAWLRLIGPVRLLPIATHIHCNWSVSPIATGAELEAINRAIEIVRAEHPYVVG